MNKSFFTRFPVVIFLVLLVACSDQKELQPTEQPFVSPTAATPTPLLLASPTPTQSTPIPTPIPPNADALDLWRNKDASVIANRLGKGATYAMALSPDGKTIAVTGLVSVSTYDFNSLETIWTSVLEQPPVATERGQVVWSPDGSQLATVSEAGITIWDAKTGERLQFFGGDEYANASSVVWTQSGKVATREVSYGHMILWDLRAEKQLLDFEMGPATLFDWLQNKSILAVAQSGNITIWNTRPRRQVSSFTCNDCYIYNLKLSPDGTRLVTVSADKRDKIIVWDIKTGAPLLTKEAPGNYAGTRFAWSPDGKYLAAGFNSNGSIVIWDIETGTQLPVLGLAKLQDIAWSADGNNLITLSRYQSVTVWDVKTGKPLRFLGEHTSWVLDVAWSPDGSMLASSSEDGEITIWDPGGKALRSLHDPGGWVRELTWSPDGNLLASAGNARIVIWDLRTGEQLRAWSLPTLAVFSLAWSPDGSMLASTSYEGTISLWDPATGKQLWSFAETHWNITGLAWSPQGDLLAGHYPQSGTSREQLAFWNPQTGELVRTQPGMLSLSWSPLGDIAASVWDSGSAYGGDDQTVILWDPRTGNEVRRFDTGVSAGYLTWSPDGRFLIAGVDRDAGRALILLDAETGEQLHRLPGHYDAVKKVAWSPRGDRIASCSWDGTVIIWEIAAP